MSPIVGAAAGLAGAYFQFRGSARDKSGWVDTSDARTLWENQAAFTRALQSELDRLRAEVDRQSKLNDSYEKGNQQLQTEIRALKMENIKLTDEIRQLRAELTELQIQISKGLN